MHEAKRKLFNRCMSFYEPKEATTLLGDLIRIPGHKQVDWQEEKIARYIHDFFSRIGINESELDYLEEYRPNVTARLAGNGDGKSLLLTGHIDTVPPYNMKVPPYEPILDRDWISGLGSADMKGSLAAMMSAVALIRKAEIDLAGDLWFAGVIDEEQNSKGTVRLVEKGFQVDSAIVGEPTNLRVCTTHKGMEWIQVTVHGKSAHGSTPEQGRNAVYHAARLALEIERLHEELQRTAAPCPAGRPSINVGVIHGGNDPNIVPNLCTLEIDRRWTPLEARKELYAEIQRIIDQMDKRYPGFICEVRPMSERVCSMSNPPLAEGSDENLLARSLCEGIRMLTGREEQPTSFEGWSDAALLNRYSGIPCVVFGPGLPEMCHSDGEKIQISQLHDAVEILVAVIIDLCTP